MLETQLATPADHQKVGALHARLCRELGFPAQGRKGRLMRDALTAAWIAGACRAVEAVATQLGDAGVELELDTTSGTSPKSLIGFGGG